MSAFDNYKKIRGGGSLGTFAPRGSSSSIQGNNAQSLYNSYAKEIEDEEDENKSPFERYASMRGNNAPDFEQIHDNAMKNQLAQAEAERQYRSEMLPELEKIKTGESDPTAIKQAKSRIAGLSEDDRSLIDQYMNPQVDFDENNRFKFTQEEIDMGLLAEDAVKLRAERSLREKGYSDKDIKALANDIKSVNDYDSGDNKGNNGLNSQETLVYSQAKIEGLSPKEREILAKQRKDYESYARKSWEVMNFGDYYDENYVVPTDAWREELKKLDPKKWTDEKLDEYDDYNHRLANATTDEKMQAQYYGIDRNASTGEKVAKSAWNTAQAINPIHVLEQGILGAMEQDHGAAGLGRDPHGAGLAMQNADEYAQGQVVNNAITEKHPVGQFLYNAGVSTAQSAEIVAAGALLGNAFGAAASELGVGLEEANAIGRVATQAFSLTPFGTQAYNSSYKDARDRGLTEDQAQALGICSGMIEAGTELLPLENLGNIFRNTKAGKVAAKNVIVQAMKQAGLEGTEEVLSDIGNRVADYIIAGEDGKNQMSLDIQAYMDNGMSYDEARQQAEIDFWKQTAEDFGAGALSGGVMAGGTVYGATKTSEYSKNREQAIQDYYKKQSESANTDTEYGESVKSQADKFAANPTQYIADHIDDSTEEGKEAKAKLQEYADKVNKGKKLTMSDRVDIEQSIYVAEEAAQNNQKSKDSRTAYEKYLKEVEEVPDQYRSQESTITVDQAQKQMYDAAKSGDLKKISDTYQAMKNSTSAQMRSQADEIYQEAYGLAENNGVAKEQLDALKISPQDAYIRGMNGETREDLGAISHEAAEAFNAGQQQRMEIGKKVVESAKSLKGSVQTNNGAAKLSGSFDAEGKVITDKGSIEVADIQDTTATKQAYVNASAQKTLNAKNAYIENIKDGVNINQYDIAFRNFYRAGETGVSFEDANKNGFSKIIADTLGKDTVKAIYDAGVSDYAVQVEKEATADVNKAFKIKKGSGSFQDVRRNPNAELNTDFMRLVAKATGLDVVLADSNESGKQAQIELSKSKITVTEDHAAQLVHELAEFTEFYNSAEYEKIRSAAMQASAKVLGADGYQQSLDNYQKAYERINSKQTALESSREMTNDFLVALMNTSEGQKALADYMCEQYGIKEAKSLGAKIKDFFKGIIDSMKNLLGNSSLNNYQKQILQGKIDDSQKIIDSFVKALDGAVKNYEKTAESKKGEILKVRNSQSIDEIEEVNLSGIPLSRADVAVAHKEIFRKLSNLKAKGKSLKVADTVYSSNHIFLYENYSASAINYEIIMVLDADDAERNIHYGEELSGNREADFHSEVSEGQRNEPEVYRRADNLLENGRAGSSNATLSGQKSASNRGRNNAESVSDNQKFSLSVDSEGNNLTEDQQRFFADSTVRNEDGSLKVMYHGTGADFTVFDPFVSGGKNGTAEGYGLYFADMPEIANAYGNNILKGYLDIKKPASKFQKTITNSDLVKLIEATCKVDAQAMVDDGEYDSLEDALKDSWVSNYVYTYDKSMQQAYKETAQKILQLQGNDMDIIQEVMGGIGVRDYNQAYEFYDILGETLGIDGFVTEWSDSENNTTHTITVALYSNQFKTIDNQNPTKDPDIRYSIDTEDDRVFYAGNTEVVKNPTDKEYMQMREDIYKERPWLRDFKDEPLLRYTYDEEGNKYYWDAMGGMHSQIEPQINKHYHTRTSQHYEWWTREDKDDYPTRYSIKVEDPKMIKFLENQDHIKTYRTFQKIGDGLYAPMNAMENGKLGYKSVLGQWEQATEAPELAKLNEKNGSYYFDLKSGSYTASGKGRTTKAAYNPYLHSSNLVFNDQFAAAYDRPNLVVVECEVPISETTSGYHAEKAKDPVGWLEWKSGQVANALKKKGIERKVMLSRWMKPVRILDNAEVAAMYKDALDGTDIKVPWNVVSPPLLTELEKVGVDIDYGYQSAVKASYEDKFVKNSLEIKDEDKGYHAGDLGKAESLGNQSGGRGTGHFGTGTYFVGNEDKLSGSYKERPHEVVDFSKYNLYKPENYRQGMNLHEFLKGVNEYFERPDDAVKTTDEWEILKDDVEYRAWERKGSQEDMYKDLSKLYGKHRTANYIASATADDEGMYQYSMANDGTWYDVKNSKPVSEDEVLKHVNMFDVADNMVSDESDTSYLRQLGYFENWNEDVDENAQDLFDISGEEAREMIRDIREEIDAANYDMKSSYTADSASTRFMKRLGYEGVDVRSIDSLDNTEYGSVIYDLKGDDLTRKQANGARYSLAVNSEGKELSEEQQAYFQSSKMRDEYGNLKVMYHGARGAGFTVFNPGRSDDNHSLFFTDDLTVAKTYSGTHELFLPDKQMSYAELDSAMQGYTSGEQYLKQDGNDVVVMEVGMDEDQEVYRGSLKGAQDFFIDSIQDIYHDTDANYQVYLNITNPLVVDADGNRWDELPEGAWNKHYGDVDIMNASGEYEYEADWQDIDTGMWQHEGFRSLEEMEKKFGRIYEIDELNNTGELFINDIYVDKNGKRIPTNTRLYADMALEQGYDGVIFNNIIDAGLYASTSEEVPSTVAVAFNPEQIKSVWNTDPSSNPDIRHSIDTDLFDILEEQWSAEERQELGSILEDGMKALKNQEVDVKAINTIATKLRSEYGSTINVKTFSDMMQKAFAYMQTADHVNYADMMRVFNEIARPVIDEATHTEGEEVYRNFVNALKKYKIKLNPGQMAEVKSAIGSYADFKKAMSPLNFSLNGTYLDSIWGEMVEASGYVLDMDISDANEPLALYDALSALKPTPVNDYGGDAEDVAKDLAMRIVEEYLGTQSDARAKKAVEKIKAKQTEYRSKVREQYRERYNKAREQMAHQVKEAKYNERWRSAETRAKYDEKVLQIKARNKKAATDLRKAQQARHEKQMISKEAKKLMKWILEPNDKNHVPTPLQEPLIEFFNALDFVEPEVKQDAHGNYYITNYKQYVTDNAGNRKFGRFVGTSKEDVLNQYNQAAYRGEASREANAWTEKMRQMQDILKAARDCTGSENADMHNFLQLVDPELADQFDDMLSRNRGVANINTLDPSDLKIVKNTLRGISHWIANQNRAFTSGANIEEQARDAIENAKRNKPKDHTRIMNSITKLLQIDMCNPETFFAFQGEQCKDIFNSFNAAFERKVSDIKQSSEFMEEVMKDVKKSALKKWTGKNAELHTFHVSGGRLDLTTAHIMSLYELAKRPQALQHILIGGIETDTVNKRKGIFKVQHAQNEGVHVTADELSMITGSLTEQQKEIADKIQQFMANECSVWGNEASEMMYNYKKFGEKEYFPIKTDADTHALNNANAVGDLLNAIEHMGFTKQVTPNADNALVLADIFDVLSEHVNQMAAYHAYAPAVKDAIRWFNYKFRTESDGGVIDQTAVQKAINANMGRSVDKAGSEYFKKFIRDINGQEKNNDIQTPWQALIGNYKGAAIGGNLRVVIQQPTAYIRAANMVSPKYLIAATPKLFVASHEMKRIKDLSPTAYWKSQGYYETAMGKSLKEIITGISTPRDKMVEYSMWLAGKADDITWACLYNAVEMEQRKETKGQNLTKDEFTARVNERFRDVIAQTQVVDATIQKSQAMRASGVYSKMITSFMAEPTKSYNMAMKAMVNDYREHGGNFLKWKSARKALIVLGITDLVNSLAQSLMDAIRYHDDDEEYYETLLKYFESNMLDNVNPLNRLPGVKDVSSALINAIKGENTYGSSMGQMLDASAVQSMIDIVTTTKKLIDGEYKKTAYAATMTYAKGFSNLTGVPIYNILREGSSFWNLFADDEHQWKKQVEKKNDKYQSFYNALDAEKSDEDLQNAIQKAMGKGGTVEDIKSGIGSKYKEAYMEAFEAGDQETMNDLRAIMLRGYKAAGYNDDDMNNLIDTWTSDKVSYSILDDAIENGGDVRAAIKVLQEGGKEDDKIIDHILSHYEHSVDYERSNYSEGNIEEQVEAALGVFGTNYNRAQEDARIKAEEKAAKQEADEKKKAAKQATYDIFESGSGDYQAAITEWYNAGADPSDIKSDITADLTKPLVKAYKQGDTSVTTKLNRIALMRAYIDEQCGTNIPKKYGGDYYQYEIDQITKKMDEYDKEPW